jgi:serine protease Do
MNDLPRMVAATSVGKKAGVKILRGGKEMVVTVTVERLREKEGEEAAQVPDKLGMGVAELNGELAARMGIGETRGVVVVDVKPASIAEEAGIAKGDIVKEINGTEINSIGDYEKAVAARKKGAVLRLLLRRGESSLFVALKVD